MSDTTTTNIDLTARQEEVLAFIAANSQCFGPTIRQIASAFNIKSPNGVICHLTALERKGRITRAKGSPRGIQVVEVQS